MSLDIWFREDILHALQAADQSSATTAAALEGAGISDPRYLRAYRQGYRAALAAIAIAFGLVEGEDQGWSGGGGSDEVTQEFFA